MPHFCYKTAEKVENLAITLASPSTTPEENRKTLIELHAVLDALRHELGLHKPRGRHLGKHCSSALDCVAKITTAIQAGKLSKFELDRLADTFQTLRESTFAVED